VKLLLSYGADISATDDDGKTPLEKSDYTDVDNIEQLLSENTGGCTIL